MWEPTPPLTIICFGSTFGVFALFWLACRELYRYWNKYIRRQPLSGVYQVVRLSSWLLGGAVIVSCGVWILWIFSLAFTVYVGVLFS